MTDQNPSTIKRSVLHDNAAGAIAYITILPAIIFLILPPYSKRPYVRFHALQCIFFYFVTYVVSWFLNLRVMVSELLTPSRYTGLDWLILAIWFVWMLIWVWCAVAALNGKRFKLPLLGALAEREAGS